MAKFCSNCGRELKEGEVCECQDNQNNIDFAGGLNKLLNLAKNMFTNPIKTIKDFKEESNLPLACSLIGITSIVVGLFMMLLVKEIYKMTVSTYTFGMYSMTSSVEIPYFKIFIIATVVSAACYFLQALILYLVNSKIFKANISYKNTLNVVSTLSVFTLASVLLSIIGIFISIYVVVILIALAAIIALAVLVLANKEVFKLHDTNTIYSIVLYLVIMAIISYLVMLIIS